MGRIDNLGGRSLSVREIPEDLCEEAGAARMLIKFGFLDREEEERMVAALGTAPSLCCQLLKQGDDVCALNAVTLSAYVRCKPGFLELGLDARTRDLERRRFPLESDACPGSEALQALGQCSLMPTDDAIPPSHDRVVSSFDSGAELLERLVERELRSHEQLDQPAEGRSVDPRSPRRWHR